MKHLTCKRCEFEWYPRTPKMPVRCPQCSSRLWQTKKKKSRRKRILEEEIRKLEMVAKEKQTNKKIT